MRGQFLIQPPVGPEIVLPNQIVDEGSESYLKQIFQADVTDVSSGGNWYVGMCNNSPDDADVLTDITGEPTSAGGYARLAITRDGTGFPTISKVNNVWRAQSLQRAWTATGADYDDELDRLFLCNVASGTSGILYAYSGALTTPLIITAGLSYSFKYEVYLD